MAGGIKVLDGYRLDRKYLNPAQQHLLKRLAKTLSGQDRDIMESILRDFALKTRTGCKSCQAPRGLVLLENRISILY